MTNKPHALPPRRERFADPAARAVWAAIVALPPALQHQILDALRDLLACLDGTSTHETRARHAVVCLREVAEHLGKSPSMFEYRRELVEHPEKRWLADSTLRSWLGGSWNDCLRTARLDTVPDGDVMIAQNGPAASAEEIASALQACARELGDVPTISAYYAWARRPDVRVRPGRRPMSQSPFDRVFGSYYKALVGAGLVNGEAGIPVARSTMVRLGGYHVGEEQMHAALREVAERLGRSPRAAEYTRAREEIIDESAAAGQPRSLPALSTLQKQYGVWDNALTAAGLTPLGGRRTGKAGARGGLAGPRISNSELLDALRDAWMDVGPPFTSLSYKEWRKQQIERDGRSAASAAFPRSMSCSHGSAAGRRLSSAR
jgi:hypothetical protein